MRVTPVGRQVAREHGLDLAAVTGTGRGGRITRRDVEAHLAATSAPPAAQSPAGAATAMHAGSPAAAGLNDAPTAWLLVEVDLTAVERASAARGGAVPALAVVLQAVARALVQQPLLNATWTPTALRLHPTVVLAVVTANGATTIIDAAERQTAAELARALAGAGQAPPPAAAPTMTVFVVGGPARAAWQPGLPPGQVAAVVVGGPTRQLVAVGDTLAARSVASLSVVFDHRALDGAPVGRFARAVRDWLEGDAWSPFLA